MILSHVVSRAVIEISEITGKIFAADVLGTPAVFNTFVWGDPNFHEESSDIGVSINQSIKLIFRQLGP